MATRKKITKAIRVEVQRLQREGRGYRAIAKTVGLSLGAVAGILGPEKKAPAAEGPAEPPPPPGPSAIDDEARAAEAALAALDEAQRRLHKLLLLTDRRMEDELGKTAPDMGLIGKLFAQGKAVRDEVIKIRPTTVRRPEDDPAHVEAARVLVGSLRARVEAGRRSRGLAP